MRRRGTSSGGLSHFSEFDTSSAGRPYSLFALASGSVASKPAVTSSPTRAPVRVRTR